ncbi:uncharacterized protein LOC119077414 [Bradysia coprophila]|uniref:uncharacterized protein LOC119077414 n=1 Tax=Bradysia coprophila TaxID=38358 RepID=UPI00187D7734|nr:uncharacterized protein LOC119077414 [Bradysia coprophila]
MLPKNVVLFLLLLHDVYRSVYCYSGSVMLKTIKKSNGKSRQKRILGLITDPQLNFYFQYNSCYALAVVVSLPLELPSSRSAFLSYNFETNYYYAYFDNAAGLVPLPFSQILEPGTNLGTKHRIELPPGYRQFGEAAGLSSELANKTQQSSNLSNSTVDVESKSETILAPESIDDAKKTEKKQKKVDDKAKLKNRKLRSLLQNYFMSRRRFFKIMESKMDSSGLNGNECLLKAICETAAHSFGQHNGVIGSVVDILFLPSASKDERLPKRYYKAEQNGKLGNCDGYNKMCPTGVFHFISKLI